MGLQMHEESDRLLVVHIDREMVKSDYPALCEVVDQLTQRQGSIRILFDLKGFNGWNNEFHWEWGRLGKGQFEAVDRIAFVGKREIEGEATNFAQPFGEAEIRFFDLESKDKARDWVVEFGVDPR